MKPFIIKMKKSAQQRISGINNNRGFTLIEIMIVVTIIAILIGLVGTNLFKKPQAAKVTATKVKMTQLGLPLLEYSNQKGTYPSSEEGLNALVSEGFAKKKDIADAWGNPFLYRYPGEHDSSEYELMSYGADGKEGGDGYNADIYSWDSNDK